jgi:predicted Zn-ribbon and HTH transcriptional regulator
MVERSISMKKEAYGVNVLIVGHRCYRCSHAWVPRDISEVPEICPKCKSPYWKKVKTIFKKGEKKNGKN